MKAPARLVALTGTPGVGKSAAAALLEREFLVIHLNELVRSSGVGEGRDRHRQSLEVDPRRLAAPLRRAVGLASRGAGPSSQAIVEGHLSHLVPGISRAIVLRLSPRVLRRRLAARRWRRTKIEENVEAEGMGIIADECRTLDDACEIDVTGMTRAQVAASVRRLARSSRPARRYALGSVDWSEDDSWY
ncbi:MAG: AAA family ATPase [Euryarchaeota archaeon]|nr:AAA family ATPase [Euryarchaeota archaeon]